MGRLIDVDEAIRQLDHNTWQGEMLIAILKGLPTAYNVDGVVERLQNDCHNYYPSIDYCCMSQKVVKLNDAIKIVKEGAVKDE